MAGGQLVEPDLNLIREIKKAGGENVKKCYQCATCSVVCNLSPADKPFPRKEMLMAGWGQAERLAVDPDLWLCYQCNDCSTHCPREAKPGNVLAAIRTYIYRSFAFPKFMGAALANPKALPLLFLLPILILAASVFWAAPQENGQYVFLNANVIDYNNFLPHSTVDAIFVFGNILIFIFAGIGFSRFWKKLKASGPVSNISFVSALMQTVKEVISHATFFECEANKPRAWGHIFLVGGFVFSMIATGAVFVLTFIPHYLTDWNIYNIHIMQWPPIELPNPVKIFGALGGLFLIIGGVILVIRRWKDKEQVGANGYADYLFLYIMFLVGLTGMFSWIARSYIGIPMFAYANYFIHMIFVFFLLWYMPYSKFAHMIYRSLALIYCKSIGRSARD